MVTEKNFKNWIILLPFLGVLVTSISLTFLFMNKIHQNYQHEIQTITTHKTSLIKANIKNRIDTLCKIIDQGFQVDDHEYSKLIFLKNQRLLNETVFNGRDYIFAYDFKGNTIAHANKKLLGVNRFDLKLNNRFLVQEMIHHPQLKEGTFLTYTASYNPTEKQSKEKISYIRSPKYVDWVIGTGIYVSDYNSDIQAIKNHIKQELQDTLNLVVYISIIVTCIGLIIMSFLSNRIYFIIHQYQQRLLSKNMGLEEKVEQRVAEQNSIMTLFDNADTVLYKWEYKNHRFKYISKNIEHILGYNSKHLMKTSFIYTKFIYDADLQNYIIENKHAIHNAVNYFEHTPYRIITKDGTVKWIREYKLLVKNEKGKIDYVIGYITDITHIKKQEQLEIESKKTMALKELINNLAHQWRQPLSVISTAASGMKLQDELEVLNSQLIQEYCQNIIEQSNYLSKTIDSFNDISVNQEHKKVLVFSDVIQKVKSLLSQVIEVNHIQLIVKTHDDTPFYFHEQSLLQLIIHLLSNSIEALSNQKGEKIIVLESRMKDNRLCIKIHDSANGINSDMIDKVFEPYFTTKHQSLGTGLGLSICQNIIETYQGSLDITNRYLEYEDKELYGLEVCIKLPIEKR